MLRSHPVFWSVSVSSKSRRYILLSQCCASNSCLFFIYYRTVKVSHQFIASISISGNLIKKKHTHTHQHISCWLCRLCLGMQRHVARGAFDFSYDGWSCSIKGVFDFTQGNRAAGVFLCVCMYVFCVLRVLWPQLSSALSFYLSMMFLVYLPVSFLTCPIVCSPVLHTCDSSLISPDVSLPLQLLIIIN